MTIGDAAENTFVQSQAGLDALIGARDATVEGAWRWEHNGVQFWSGGSGGSAVGGAYANWDQPLNQPNNGGLFGNEDCGLISTVSGKWFDVSCSTGYWYVCEEDLCPSDAGKEAPGQCGCGAPDTDTDGDGTANCNDECPADATRVDLPCAPEPNCTYAVLGASEYFFCSGQRTHAAARAKCATVGLQLARIDSAAENAWLDQQIATDRWVGGSDLDEEARWAWDSGGDPFWQGDFTGAPVLAA